MATAQFAATARSGQGKGDARKLRSTGQVPAVIYGNNRDPQSLALNARDFDKLLEKIPYGSTVIELDAGGRTAMTLIREIQRHPVKNNVIHVDFQELVAGEKVTVNVPIVFVGTADGVRNGGGILDQVLHQVEIHVDPTAIPNHLPLDVTALGIGHSLHVRDLQLPEGVEVLNDEDATICVVSAPKAEEVVEPVAATTDAAPDASAEPELIRKAKPEDEEAEK
ncbi:MAG TPA: 50S ribosomal protein L25/general stress protein Ctc [Gemmatimonadaceae bacterium]|nr:50S ribosomal protein L25/general stress protein Ctc [Gemmatimonadaceae bacterium]